MEELRAELCRSAARIEITMLGRSPPHRKANDSENSSLLGRLQMDGV